MMRVNGGPMTVKRWMLASAVGAFLLACGDSGGKSDTTKAAGPPGRTDIVNEAESNYTFGSERQPVPVDTTIINAPGGALPTMTIATATQTSGRGRVPGNRFIYKLHSSAAYATMGLAPGDNYVWRDTISGPEGPYRTLVVPKDTTYPMIWLRRDTAVASYAALPAVEPRLVKSFKGFGACDNNCTPHCATRSVLRTFTIRDTLNILFKP